MTDKSILDFTQQHEFFAQELLFFVGTQQWQQAHVKYEVFNQMIAIERWFVFKSKNFGWVMKFQMKSGIILLNPFIISEIKYLKIQVIAFGACCLPYILMVDLK